MHDTFFDVDFLETNQNEVGTSRTKLPVYHNVEPVGVEPKKGGGVPSEDGSLTPEGAIQLSKRASQLSKRASFPPEGACEPSDALLLLAVPNSGEASNERRTKASDSTFNNGSYLHEGQFFSSKKELMNKLTVVGFKGHFEFRT